jgi:hypothetical protein
MPGPRVKEVDRVAVDVGHELIDGVEIGLDATPVVGRSPVLGDLPEILERHAL